MPDASASSGERRLGPSNSAGTGEVTSNRRRPRIQRVLREWGDHVDAPLPDYVTGEECLFCHRDDWGNRWAKNYHQRTVRAVEADSPAMKALAADADTKSFVSDSAYLLGTRRQIRFLKRSNEYGKFGLLSAAYTPVAPGANSRRAHGKLTDTKGVHWDEQKFAKSCAGCHTTAVDPQTHAFSAISLDCYACHGVVNLLHSKDTKLVAFEKGIRTRPRCSLRQLRPVSSSHGPVEKERLALPDEFRRRGQFVPRLPGRLERRSSGSNESGRPTRGPERSRSCRRQFDDHLRQLSRHPPAKFDEAPPSRRGSHVRLLPRTRCTEIESHQVRSAQPAVRILIPGVQ